MRAAPVREASVQSALAELTRPLIASTATVIVVFLPLIFLSGVTGVFFRALAFTLGGGLAVSLVAGACTSRPRSKCWSSAGGGAGRGPGRLFRIGAARLRTKRQAVSPLPRSGR